MRKTQLFIKRSIDIVISLSLLILSLPVMTLCSILIFALEGSPIFFRQRRPGLGEQIFTILKFRTMKNETSSNMHDQERITFIGNYLRKSSLDELPQLINVLRGELSLVGPRPLLEEYLPLYNNIQKKRHLVKPGITGWAQVNGRNAITWEQKFAYDVWYVENWTLLLDFKILLLTAFKVCKRSDVNANEQITMNKFNGTINDE